MITRESELGDTDNYSATDWGVFIRLGGAANADNGGGPRTETNEWTATATAAAYNGGLQQVGVATRSRYNTSVMV